MRVLAAFLMATVDTGSVVAFEAGRVQATPAASPASAAEKPAAVGRLGGRVRRGDTAAEAVPMKLCGLVPVEKKARGGGVAWDGCRTDLAAVTDASGRYSFADLAPGQYAVLARSGGGWSHIGSPVHPGSSQVRLGTYHLFIATYAVKPGAETTAETIQLVDQLKRIEPVADAQVSTGNPTLRWQAVPGAAYYEITLHKVSPLRRGDQVSGWVTWGKPVFERRRVDTASALTVKEPLTNCDYGWDVAAFSQGGMKVGQVTGGIGLSHFTVTGQRTSCN